ncbi:pleiotropic drug resistance protein 3-like [Gossypium australe]|uniref:Pleiotropic drug resistance protein 3-like n=1 Tax=Gossypium australe TaxID=47621 RepID=A0A5B6WIA1_9ROSI|nr:pleiotropic drug resistance protein 3-like [Gossypium australe]
MGSNQIERVNQQFGVDSSKTFTPVARLDTIRLLLALEAQTEWKIHQLDGEIYVKQPQGFIVKRNEPKALYGLKQTPRARYEKIHNQFLNLGFERSLSEPTLYMKKLKKETLLIVSLYIDDLLVTRSSEKLLFEFKKQIESVFEISDFDEMEYFLGMEILKKFCIENCKLSSTPVAQSEKLSSKNFFERVNENSYRILIG